MPTTSPLAIRERWRSKAARARWTMRGSTVGSTITRGRAGTGAEAGRAGVGLIACASSGELDTSASAPDALPASMIWRRVNNMNALPGTSQDLGLLTLASNEQTAPSDSLRRGEA